MAQATKKSNSRITSQWAGSELTLSILGADAGGTEDRKLVFNYLHASSECREAAERNGWLQRLSDAAAIGRDPSTGLSATPGEKADAIAELIEWYESGTTEWKRSGGGGERSSLLLRALMEAYPDKSEEQLRAYLKDKSAGDKAKIRANAKVLPIIQRMEAEAAKGLKADDLIEELEGL